MRTGHVRGGCVLVSGGSRENGNLLRKAHLNSKQSLLMTDKTITVESYCVLDTFYHVVWYFELHKPVQLKIN